MRAELKLGDCLERLRELPDASLDSLVTDPPAGIAFMGKEWDKDKGGRDSWVAWMTNVMRECLRVLKPGAHGLVWALPRTSHWTATALENAGFEIRDVVTHLFGTGFPKSLDISKAIDKAAGAERTVLGVAGKSGSKRNAMAGDFAGGEYMETAPATAAAAAWQGWGTALKPASEHWILVRKPCSEKTVAANVLKHGTGGINVDGCRVSAEGLHEVTQGKGNHGADGWGMGRSKYQVPFGRFPANLVFSHSEGCAEECDPGCAVRLLDEQSGTLKSGDLKPYKRKHTETVDFKSGLAWETANRKGDSGGASRFFYCAKASKSDRNRKVTSGEQAPDRKEHEPDELFDSAGNPARGHSA